MRRRAGRTIAPRWTVAARRTIAPRRPLTPGRSVTPGRTVASSTIASRRRGPTLCSMYRTSAFERNRCKHQSRILESVPRRRMQCEPHDASLRALNMAITRETVLHVAKLARLELGDSELERMQKDLGNILEYVNSLAELDTASVPETTQVAVLGTPLRADQVEPSLANEVALSQAPRSAGGGFAVPAFVDE